MKTKPLFTIFSFLAACIVSGCEPATGPVSVSGTIRNSVAGVAFPASTSFMLVATYYNTSYQTSARSTSDLFGIDASGQYAISIDPGMRYGQLTNIHVQVIGNLGILIQSELSRLNAETGNLITRQIYASCKLELVSRRYAIAPEALNVSETRVTSFSQDFEVTLAQSDLDALKECQLDIYRRFVN